MSIRIPDAEEHPKTIVLQEMAMWKASLLSAVFHVFVTGGLVVGDAALDGLPSVHETQHKQKRKVGDILAEMEAAKMAVKEVEEAKGQKIDEYIERYLDSSAESYTGGTAPLEAYLELDSYDSVAHWLSHLPPREAAQKDWKTESQRRKKAWIERYDKALQRILAQNHSWTGNVIDDFPLLQSVMYLQGNAFFAQGSQGVRYAKNAETPHEQLELGLVQCTSSRFTPWLLEAIYESRGMSTEGLKNLKTISWNDHISSFYDQGEGFQLQEMDTDTPVMEGVNSPETGNPGAVRSLNTHLAVFIEKTSPAHQKRLDQLGYEHPKLKYALKDPPALNALQEAEAARQSSEEPLRAEVIGSSINSLSSDDKSFENLGANQKGGLYFPPAWIKDERARKFVLRKMHENALQASDMKGVNTQAFGEVELFLPEDAEKLTEELIAEYEGGLPQLARDILGGASHKIPPTLLGHMIRDAEASEELASIIRKGSDDLYWIAAVRSRLAVLRQVKSARIVERVVNPTNTLPPFNVPEDAEEELKEKLLEINKLSFLKDDIELTANEFDFKKGDVKWIPLLKKYQRDPKKLEQITQYFEEEAFVDLLVTLEDEELRAALKGFFVEKIEFRKEYIPPEKREPVATWIRESLLKQRSAGKISDLELYYVGWEEVIPPGEEKINIEEYFGKNNTLLTTSSSPQPGFINLFRTRYLNGSDGERLQLLETLGRENMFLIPITDLYPEDREWIAHNQGDQGNRLRFFYAEEMDFSTLGNGALRMISGPDVRNITWTGVSWDRVAALWEEMERRQ